jgi:hypothetical protein
MPEATTSTVSLDDLQRAVKLYIFTDWSRSTASEVGLDGHGRVRKFGRQYEADVHIGRLGRASEMVPKKGNAA